MPYPTLVGVGSVVSVGGYSEAPKLVPMPSGVQNGDVIFIVGMTENGSEQLSVTGGYTQLQKIGGGPFRGSMSVHYRVYNSADTPPTAFPGNVYSSYWQAFAFRGVDATSPIEFNGATAELYQTIGIPDRTAITAETLHFVLCANYDGYKAVITPNSPLTSISSNSAAFGAFCVATANGPVTAGTVVAKTFSTNSTGNHGIIDVILKNGSEPGPTPIAFQGTVPGQTAATGSTFSLNLSTYFTGNQRPFSFAIQSGTLPAGLSLSGSTISGTPTAAATATIVVRAIDSANNTANSNSFTITVSDVAPPPQGTFTIGAITAGVNTVSVPYTYSASDQTSIQYRLNGGSAVTATASPQSLSGLTASTAYTIAFRAINADGQGSWSSPANFTTQAAPVVQGTFTSEPLYRLVDGALMASKALTYFRLYNPSNGALVVSKTGVSTNSSGVVSFTDASVVTGTTYKADWQTADGEFCMPSKAAT